MAFQRISSILVPLAFSNLLKSSLRSSRDRLLSIYSLWAVSFFKGKPPEFSKSINWYMNDLASAAVVTTKHTDTYFSHSFSMILSEKESLQLAVFIIDEILSSRSLSHSGVWVVKRTWVICCLWRIENHLHFSGSAFRQNEKQRVFWTISVPEVFLKQFSHQRSCSEGIASSFQYLSISC